MLNKLIMSLFSLLFIASLTYPAHAINYKKIEKGELDIEFVNDNKSHVKQVRAVGLIKAPRDKVWKAVIDYKNYPKFMPRVEKVSIKKKKGNFRIVYMKLDTPWPFSNVWYTNRYKLDPNNYSVKWLMLDGSIKENRGSWKLKKYKNNSTLAIYQVKVDLGLSFVPQWVINHVSKITIPTIFKRVKYYLENT